MSGRAGSADGELQVRELLDLLPSLRLLVPLRERLLSASQRQATAAWDREQGYATLDRRVLAGPRLDEVLDEAVRRETAQLRALMEGVGTCLRARARGDRRGAVTALRDGAADLAEAGRHFEAAALLEVAVGEVARVEDRALEADVVRRLARSSWRSHRLERAAELYLRAGALFGQLGDVANRIVALQGLGNVRAAQGRWDQAEARHREALDLCGDHDGLLRGQIYNNLSQVTRRRGRLDEARSWQSRAEATWQAIDAPVDEVVALNNAGLLCLAEGSLDDARTALHRGLSRATDDHQRAALLVNLAQVEVRAGDGEKARGIAREAEEFSLVVGATDLLIEAYTVLGVVARERGDDACVAFFEKALELASGDRFRLGRAAAHREYARYRRDIGDQEEAAAHLARARAIFADLDAAPELRELDAESGGEG